MSTKAQVKTQAKTPAAPAAVRIPQPPVGVPERAAGRPDIAAQLEGAARLGHSLGAVSVEGSPPPIIQRQELQEEEELQLKREPAAIQRQELPEEEEEEELQMKPEPAALQRQELPEEEEEEEELMLKRDSPQVGLQGGQVPPDVEAAIRRARGGGQPLGDALQEQMSANLGHDFSGVRVHTGPEADELNQQLHAKAFTTSADIFFKRGAYEPSSDSGRELIAHELSHVVQQGTGRVLAEGGGSGTAVRSPGDALEREADAMATTGLRLSKKRALQRSVANPALASPAAISASQHRYGNRAGQGVLNQAKREKDGGSLPGHQTEGREVGTQQNARTSLVVQRVTDEDFEQAKAVAAHIKQGKVRVVVVPNSAMLGPDNPAICVNEGNYKQYQRWVPEWLGEEEHKVDSKRYKDIKVGDVLIKENVLSQDKAWRCAIIWHEMGHALRGKSEPPAYQFEVEQLIRAVDEKRLGSDEVDRVLSKREDQYRKGMTDVLATLLERWEHRRKSEWPYA